MSVKQRTLKESVTFRGKGLHTGLDVVMNVLPAAENHGITFRRTDLEGQPAIAALADHVTDTSRGTTIEKNGVRVSTIEHLMASLWMCGVDNALVEINAPETPILDGSAKEYTEKILAAGTVEQATDRCYYEINEKIEFSDPAKGVQVTVYPDDHYSLTVNIDYKSKVLGHQYASICDTENPEEFATQVAPCRTFVFLHELEPLFKNNLIKGGDLDNALVIVENPMPDEEIARIASVFNKKDIKVQSSGYLSNTELRFSNEAARHKLLDLLGDLALVGMRIRGKVVATRPGHFANTEVAKLIRKNIRRDETAPAYKYDPNATPVYDINQIKGILPHRPPFLLVDKIMEMGADHIVGIKNVTMNEGFFVGHFPEEPVMPGVLIVEAMAQCGGILALSTVPDPENYSTYFMKIDNVRFRRKVVPGDTLTFMLEFTEPIRRGIVMMNAKAYVGNQLATESFLMAQIVKNKNVGE